MLNKSLPIHDSSVEANREAFCRANNVNLADVVYQRIRYDEKMTYDIIQEVDETMTMRSMAEVPADGLFTRRPGVGMFLPVADCVATIIYDPSRRYLAMLHMGRHSTMAGLLPKMLKKFSDEGSQPRDLLVWMSPAAGRGSYKMQYFDKKTDPAWQPFVDEKSDGIYLDLRGFNRQACLNAGILADNIDVSTVDVMATPTTYFSHAMGDINGRMAALAMMI